MKIKIDNKNYDVEIQLPNELQNAISVQKTLDEWVKLIEKERLKKLRKIRFKKINEINKHVGS